MSTGSNQKTNDPHILPIKQFIDSHRVGAYSIIGDANQGGAALTLTDTDGVVTEFPLYGLSFDEVNKVVAYVRSRII